MPRRSVLLVGCGNMGGALLAGWQRRRTEGESITVVEPDERKAGLLGDHGRDIVCVASPAALYDTAAPSAVVFAVKPQVLGDVAAAYRPFVPAGALFLSIAAGTTLAGLDCLLGGGAAIVRAMPNTPAAVGAGITVACANPVVSPTQRDSADELLAAVGEVAWVEDESLLDPVTAVSGSGPAYVFLLAECLADAGVAAGLPRPLADRLARATVIGAGHLLARAHEDPSELRRNVTSPGGTTEAALRVLMGEAGMMPLLTAAVTAAAARARELARGKVGS